MRAEKYYLVVGGNELQLLHQVSHLLAGNVTVQHLNHSVKDLAKGECGATTTACIPPRAIAEDHRRDRDEERCR